MKPSYMDARQENADMGFWGCRGRERELEFLDGKPSGNIHREENIYCPWCGDNFYGVEDDQEWEGNTLDFNCALCGENFTVTVHVDVCYTLQRKLSE